VLKEMGSKKGEWEMADSVGQRMCSRVFACCYFMETKRNRIRRP